MRIAREDPRLLPASTCFREEVAVEIENVETKSSEEHEHQSDGAHASGADHNQMGSLHTEAVRWILEVQESLDKVKRNAWSLRTSAKSSGG